MSTQDPLKAQFIIYEEAQKIIARCYYARDVFVKGTNVKPNKFFMYEGDLIKLRYSHELMIGETGKDILFNMEIVPIKQNRIYCAYVLEVNDYE